MGTAGRPSIYSVEIADAICDRLIEGESLRKICADENMPGRATVLRWQNDNADFEAKCTRARVMQADLMDDLILDTAHKCTPETANADKVKISAYQWRAAKLLPKKYGERLDLNQNITQGEVSSTPASEEEKKAEWRLRHSNGKHPPPA
jgi:hypothetical protein